jgi:hypothetical protein
MAESGDYHVELSTPRESESPTPEHAMSNSSFDDLARRFLSGIPNLQRSSKAERQQLLRPVRGRVPIVPCGIGAFCPTTWDSLEALSDFGRKWRSQCPERKRRLEGKRIPDFVLGIVGDILATKQLDKLAELDIGAFSKQLQQGLTDRLARTKADIEYSFPCHLFDDVNVGQFNIGPVRFLPRLNWLDHVEEHGGGDANWAKLVRAAWGGGSATTEDIIIDKWRAETISTGFRDCCWVAIVMVTTNELGRSDEAAGILARLAIDALGAPMSASRAIRLAILGDALDLSRCIAVLQSPGGKSGIWFRSPDLRMGDETNAAQDFLQATADYRDAAGRAFEELKTPSSNGSASLRRRWCDALFWFGAARRNTTEFMALVHYGVALDILAKGGKDGGITDLLSKLFARSPTEETDGTTLKGDVENLYKQARSQLSHGGRPALLEDMPLSREKADQLVASALCRYICCLDRYDGTDAYATFLAAIPSLVQ